MHEGLGIWPSYSHITLLSTTWHLDFILYSIVGVLCDTDRMQSPEEYGFLLLLLSLLLLLVVVLAVNVFIVIYVFIYVEWSEQFI